MNKLNENIKTKEEKIEKRISRFWKFCIFLIILGFGVALLGIYIFEMKGTDEFEKFGNFSAGTVASVWSLAGVILIYIAFLGQKLELLYQKEELQLNRKELEETRKVMSEQRKEFELQNSTLLKQNFENLFFQLLRNYSEIVQHMDIDRGSEKITGRDCFNKLFYKFRGKYDELSQFNIEAVRIDTAYFKFYKEFQSDLGNYFRNLYNIFKFINISDVEDKKMYSNIVRAQLSTFELALLFYNCLSRYGRLKFKPLIEEFNLVKNLPKNLLIKPEHADLYSKILFEEDEW